MTVQNQLQELLTSQLSCSTLEIVNESHMHAGFYDGKESHFKVTIVSPKFDNMRLVQRHQMVYQLVAELLTANGGSIHALALHTFTEAEWQTHAANLDSPQCSHQQK